MKVGIITDSTCDLGEEYLEAHDVLMVPMHIQVDDKSFLDVVDFSSEEFFDIMTAAKSLPSSSQPSPAEIEKYYKQLIDQGCDHIVCVFISSKMSGTCNSAELAAEECSVPVTVIDSRTVTAALGFCVKAAVRARDAGLNPQEIEKAVLECRNKTRLYIALDTLENLVKGGRAAKATGFVANLLNIKPIITIDDEGEVAPWQKVKGFKKGISTLAEHMNTVVNEDGPVDYMVIHTAVDSRINEMRQAVDAQGVDAHYVGQTPLSPVVTIYGALGAVGYVTTARV